MSGVTRTHQSSKNEPFRYGNQSLRTSQDGVQPERDRGCGEGVLHGLAVVDDCGDVQVLVGIHPAHHGPAHRRRDGIEATRRITGAGGRTRVLILTTFDLDEYAFAGLRAGASGFLVKDAQPAELLSGIRSAASGDAVTAPALTRRLIEEYAHLLPSRTDADVAPDPRLAVLTGREREVLAAIARGWTNGEIIDRPHLAEPTVKTHVGRVLAKIGVRGRVQAVIIAYDARLVRPA